MWKMSEPNFDELEARVGRGGERREGEMGAFDAPDEQGKREWNAKGFRALAYEEGASE